MWLFLRLIKKPSNSIAIKMKKSFLDHLIIVQKLSKSCQNIIDVEKVAPLLDFSA